MAGKSPTENSLAVLKAQCWICEVVEKWVPRLNIRKDLFGFIDILCVKDGQTLAVQTTSDSNVSARVRKITESEFLPEVRKAGWLVHVHGWRKAPKVKGGKAQIWKQRVVDLS